MNNVTNPPGVSDRLRLALVSTPRSGNTWLRSMLAGALELHERATHRPSDVNWDALPERLILQIHWHRKSDFEAQLEQNGFRVVVICRHPLDVLLSLLTYVQHSRETASWLDGLGGDERDLDGASPLDAAFVHYGTGPRARALLEVGTQWWSAPGTVRIRYEDLVDDPHAHLTRLLGDLQVAARQPLEEVISRCSPQAMRSVSVDMQFHVWQARPGLWKRLIPAAQAQAIYQAQQDIFQALEYSCDLGAAPAPSEAQALWASLDQAALRRNLFGLKRTMNEAQARNFAHVQSWANAFHGQFGEFAARQHADAEQRHLEFSRQQSELDWLRSERDWLRAEVESMKGQLAGLPLAELRELGPWSLGAAAALHRGARRFPQTAARIKYLAGYCRRTLRRALG